MKHNNLVFIEARTYLRAVYLLLASAVGMFYLIFRGGAIAGTRLDDALGWPADPADGRRRMVGTGGAGAQAGALAAPREYFARLGRGQAGAARLGVDLGTKRISAVLNRLKMRR